MLWLWCSSDGGLDHKVGAGVGTHRLQLVFEEARQQLIKGGGRGDLCGAGVGGRVSSRHKIVETVAELTPTVELCEQLAKGGRRGDLWGAGVQGQGE